MLKLRGRDGKGGIAKRFGEKVDVPDDRFFEGLDGYKRLVDSDCDLVVIATPPAFKPQQFDYAVSKGKTASISPKAWTIVDGKLYLNHAFAQGSFKKDVEGAIERADENWPKIEKKPLD